MHCHQVLSQLTELTLPQLRQRQYAALRRHLQNCTDCQPSWSAWLRHEEQLAAFLAPQPAPPAFRERLMARIGTDDQPSVLHTRLPCVVEMSSHGVRRLQFDPLPAQSVSHSSQPLAARVHEQLKEYFSGERAIFQVPVDLQSCSDFERAVLSATAAIPYGEVRSYKWIAECIGRPAAARAVGNALHNNPVPILVPCHRVVKSDGSPGGYALGSEWKIRLLTLERNTTPFVGCSSTRILCYRGCHHERRIRPGNRIHFAQISEALQNGYRGCTACQPRHEQPVSAEIGAPAMQG